MAFSPPRGLLPERVLNCGDLERVKSLLLSDIGVGLLPRRVAEYGHEGKLRPLHPDLPVYQDRIFLLYRSDMHRTRGALKLKNALVAHGQELDRTWDVATSHDSDAHTIPDALS